MYFKNEGVVFSMGVGSDKSTITQYHLYIGSFGSVTHETNYIYV